MAAANKYRVPGTPRTSRTPGQILPAGKGSLVVNLPFPLMLLVGGLYLSTFIMTMHFSPAIFEVWVKYTKPVAIAVTNYLPRFALDASDLTKNGFEERIDFVQHVYAFTWIWVLPAILVPLIWIRRIISSIKSSIQFKLQSNNSSISIFYLVALIIFFAASISIFIYFTFYGGGVLSIDFDGHTFGVSKIHKSNIWALEEYLFTITCLFTEIVLMPIFIYSILNYLTMIKK